MAQEIPIRLPMLPGNEAREDHSDSGNEFKKHKEDRVGRDLEMYAPLWSVEEDYCSPLDSRWTPQTGGERGKP